MPETAEAIVRVAGRPCPVCGRMVEVIDEYNTLSCSDFCASTPGEDQDIFRLRAMNPGDFGVYPCSGCGVALEGDWDPHNFVCRACLDKTKRERRDNLLQEAQLQLRIIATDKKLPITLGQREHLLALVQTIEEEMSK